FRVPVRFFKETTPRQFVYETSSRPGDDFPFELIPGGRTYQWYTQKTEEYFYEYEGHVIWGLTARVIRAFLEIVKT
ncbi:MAG: CoA pyrophosphatase, partial [Lachnospiraceae bacterium]|nr:CoA pyrophosphatase [Lachnospiraceae bacterium]